MALKNPAKLDTILRDIDATTEPGKMTKKEALDWLESMIADLEGRCEALKEEMADE